MEGGRGYRKVLQTTTGPKLRHDCPRRRRSRRSTRQSLSGHRPSSRAPSAPRSSMRRGSALNIPRWHRRHRHRAAGGTEPPWREHRVMDSTRCCAVRCAHPAFLGSPALRGRSRRQWRFDGTEWKTRSSVLIRHHDAVPKLGTTRPPRWDVLLRPIEAHQRQGRQRLARAHERVDDLQHSELVCAILWMWVILWRPPGRIFCACKRASVSR